MSDRYFDDALGKEVRARRNPNKSKRAPRENRNPFFQQRRQKQYEMDFDEEGDEFYEFEDELDETIVDKAFWSDDRDKGQKVLGGMFNTLNKYAEHRKQQEG